jgi:hypothetical protein
MKYWQRFATRSLSRRQAMAATGAAAASAAFLAACGGDGGDGKQGGKSGTGLLATPLDSSGSAKAGGVLKFFSAADIDHHATISATSQTVSLSEPFYPRMLGPPQQSTRRNPMAARRVSWPRRGG